MPNVFDQFDQAAPQAANVFDQFDQKQQGGPPEVLGLGQITIPGIGKPSLIGAIKGLYEAGKSAFTLPGDVMAGRVAPESPEGIRRAFEMASLASPASAGRTAVAVTRPATQEGLAAAVGQGYEAARNLGATFEPQAVRQSLQEGRSAISRYDPELVPTTTRMLERERRAYEQPPLSPGDQYREMVGLPTGPRPERAPVPSTDLESFRRRLGDLIQDQSISNTDRAAARTLQAHIDNFVSQHPVLGPATATARENAAANFKFQAIDNLLTRARDQAGGAGSGLNFENSLRGQIKSFIRPDERGRSEASRSGFSEGQVDALRAMERGQFKGNLARALGNMLGGGGGIGATVAGSILSTVLGPLAFAAPAIGAGLRLAGGRAVENRAADFAQQIINQSPYGRALAGAPRVGMMPISRVPTGSSLLALRALQDQAYPQTYP